MVDFFILIYQDIFALGSHNDKIATGIPIHRDTILKNSFQLGYETLQPILYDFRSLVPVDVYSFFAFCYFKSANVKPVAHCPWKEKRWLSQNQLNNNVNRM